MISSSRRLGATPDTSRALAIAWNSPPLSSCAGDRLMRWADGKFETLKARMIFDFDAMTPMQRFDFLTGTVVPRPIALVTTQSPDGLVNAAPYSFFNIMGIDPPVVACTVLPTPDGRLKDTGRNIRATHEFVVNLVSEPTAQPMNITYIDAPPDVEELVLAGLTHAASRKVKAPRILNSPVSFECVLHTEIPLSVPISSSPWAALFTLMSRMRSFWTRTSLPSIPRRCG